MNRVNIILATYNGEKYISEQIESIIKNSYKDWKLWIFDDGSTDRTGTIVESYIKKYPKQIHFHSNERNKGVTLNFLEGTLYANKCNQRDNLKAAEIMQKETITDYFMFCDQDDVWMTDKIEITLNQMKKMEQKFNKSSILAVFTDASVVDENLNEIHPSFYQVNKLNTKKLDLPHIMMENKLIGCTVMFNHMLLNKMEKLPGNARYHDWWVAMIASAYGHISFLPKATLFYRQHSNNVVGNQSFHSYVKLRIASLNKQKVAINKIIKQADDFYQIFRSDLQTDKKMQVYTLSQLHKYNWFQRRLFLLKYGFLKTGLIRNIGLFCII
jgi:glycosyltransferase involved in cell wall biosynthesis